MKCQAAGCPGFWIVAFVIETKSTYFAPPGDYLSSCLVQLQRGLDYMIGMSINRRDSTPISLLRTFAVYLPEERVQNNNLTIFGPRHVKVLHLTDESPPTPSCLCILSALSLVRKTEKWVLAFSVTHHFCLMNYPSCPSSSLKVMLLLRGSTTPLTLIPF